MGRRRRRVSHKRPVRAIPTIFNCPLCGRSAVRVELDRRIGEAMVQCGNCDNQATIKITNLTEPIDVYGQFVDICASRSKTSTESSL